jgi:hypothetical protein
MASIKTVTVGGTAYDLKAERLTLDSMGTWAMPVYFTGGKPATISYLNTHPENAGIIIPFLNNDLGHLTKRGGS